MSEESKVLPLPEGRLINEGLFEKEAFKADKSGMPGTPQYKVEIAFDPALVEGEGTIEDHLYNAAIEEWGDTAGEEFVNGDIILPYISGDRLAKARAEKGKPGDAYEGKTVIRANTQFNKFGQNAPGGVQVFDEDVKEVTAVNRNEIYQGCYGIAGVTIGTYLDNRGNKAMKFYLNAFQKTKDGEKLVTNADHSTLFKPMGKSGEVEGVPAGRRRRRG